MQGAQAQGYTEVYWTLDRIAGLIWDKFKVQYHPIDLKKKILKFGL